MLEQADAHLEWILARVETTSVERVPLPQAAGLAIAETVRARLDLPLWDCSAMDGYAIRSGDTIMRPDPEGQADSDDLIALRVLGEIAAGSSSDPSVPAGGAVRIMTGAPVPGDTDCVVPVERTVPADPADLPRPPDAWARTMVRVPQDAVSGANIRRRGEDLQVGDVIANPGDRADAALLSAIAASGATELRVHRRPRIAVLSTGAELASSGETLDRGRIPESNSLLISGLLAEMGLSASSVSHTGDDAEHLAEHLAELARDYDAVVTTGGIGPGLHDVVRISLESEPGIRPRRVAVRPGQPQLAGRHSGGAFVFGLPGNPVSAAVSFELFARPALLAMAGFRRRHRLRLTAIASESWRGSIDRLQVVPVHLEQSGDGLRCSPATSPRRAKHSIAGHGNRDGYALVEIGRGDVQAGETVQVIEVGAR